MILDGITLNNLEILHNTADGSDKEHFSNC